jgi:hypothetical protein
MPQRRVTLEKAREAWILGNEMACHGRGDHEAVEHGRVGVEAGMISGVCGLQMEEA